MKTDEMLELAREIREYASPESDARGLADLVLTLVPKLGNEIHRLRHIVDKQREEILDLRESLARYAPVVDAARAWYALHSTPSDPEAWQLLAVVGARMTAEVRALNAAERLDELAEALPDPGTGLLAARKEGEE
jgi:hypothetical protein